MPTTADAGYGSFPTTVVGAWRSGDGERSLDDRLERGRGPSATVYITLARPALRSGRPMHTPGTSGVPSAVHVYVRRRRPLVDIGNPRSASPVRCRSRPESRIPCHWAFSPCQFHDCGRPPMLTGLGSSSPNRPNAADPVDICLPARMGDNPQISNTSPPRASSALPIPKYIDPRYAPYPIRPWLPVAVSGLFDRTPNVFPGRHCCGSTGIVLVRVIAQDIRVRGDPPFRRPSLAPSPRPLLRSRGFLLLPLWPALLVTLPPSAGRLSPSCGPAIA